MEQGPLGWLQLLDLVAVQFGLALVLGAWASSRRLGNAGSAWSIRCADWSLTAARAGVVLGFLALGVAIWLQAAVMADVPLGQAGPTVIKLLRDTHYGHVALVGLAAWVAIAPMVWSGRGHSAMLLGVLVMAWSRSSASHAANGGDSSMDVAVDVVHIMATSLWVGMVLVATRLPLPASAMADRLDASRWVQGLSSDATFALMVVVLTGVFKVYRGVPDWALLPGSDYARALFVKLALVAVAVLLGGYNRFRVLPGLRAVLVERGESSLDPVWTRRFLRVLRIEMMVLLLVVAWAAVLASTEPPG